MTLQIAFAKIQMKETGQGKTFTKRHLFFIFYFYVPDAVCDILKVESKVKDSLVPILVPEAFLHAMMKLFLLSLTQF